MANLKLPAWMYQAKPVALDTQQNRSSKDDLDDGWPRLTEEQAYAVHLRYSDYFRLLLTGQHRR